MSTTHPAINAPGASPGRPLRFARVGHLATTGAHALLFGNAVWLMPMLARLHFEATDWQTTLITAALPTCLMLSIFWSAIFRGRPLWLQLLIFWSVAALPAGLVGGVTSYNQLLACQVVMCIGLSAWIPLNGQLLKVLYSDRKRGRAYGWITVAALLIGMAGVFGLGEWMDAYPDAFRLYMPLAAGVLLACLLLLGRTAAIVFGQTPRPPRQRSLKQVLEPIAHMGSILNQDRRFLRYEIAFMTYGMGFMFCDALLPILADKRLGVDYKAYAHSTQLAVKLGTLIVTPLAGLFHDRIGPIRLTAISFALLGAYPVFLLLATDVNHLTLGSVFFGIALAGVGMGWMLGPVTLARTPELVPQYSAIHASMVGIRGVLFQGIGLALYKASGGFTFPLLVAFLALLAAAAQMWSIRRSLAPTQVELSQTPSNSPPSEVADPCPPSAKTTRANS